MEIERLGRGDLPGLNDLARRFALGQAMRTHGPLARNNVAVSLRRDDALFSHVRYRELSFRVIHFELSATPGQRPTRSNSLGQAISVGPGIRTNTNDVEAQRAGSSVITGRAIERLARWAAMGGFRVPGPGPMGQAI